MNIKNIISLLLLSVLFFSCDKYKDYRSATVIDTGDITYEGCGYLLMMDADHELLKPLHLPGAMQHPNMRVKLTYNHTGLKDTCDYGSKLYDVINISDIVKIND